MTENIDHGHYSTNQAAVPSRLELGFAGIGQMGGPMVRRLRDSQYQVTAYDRSAEALERLEGETWLIAADSPTALTASDVVITMLPDSNAVEHVLVASGLAQQLRPGAAVIDMSSSDPRRTRKLASMLAQRGLTLLDAPVSGGVSGATSGSLSIMVGGDKSSVQTWRCDHAGRGNHRRRGRHGRRRPRHRRPAHTPYGVAVTAHGGFLIADTYNQVVQKVEPAG